MEIPKVNELYREAVQKAIGFFESNRTFNSESEQDQAIALAIDIMKKELPQKITNPIKMRTINVLGMCPRCSNNMEYGHDRCEECGQVVDWT